MSFLERAKQKRHPRSAILAGIWLLALSQSTGQNVPWPVNGGPDNIRYSALDQINRTNVTQLQVAWSVYRTSIIEGLYVEDAWMGIIKPFVLGFVIVSIGCHVGMRTKGGTQGVGRATTQAVVAASVAVLTVDFFLTRLLFTLMY